MKTYLISFENNKINNQEFYNAIGSFTESYQILETMWAIKTTSKAVTILNTLTPYIDDSGLFIVQSTRNMACTQILCPTKWLIDNI